MSRQDSYGCVALDVRGVGSIPVKDFEFQTAATVDEAVSLLAAGRAARRR